MKACINGNWMGYDDVGVGPAVILLHSFPLCRPKHSKRLALRSRKGAWAINSAGRS